MRAIFVLMLLPGLALAGQQAETPADRVGATGAEPLVMRSAQGGAFHPDRLVLLAGGVARVAVLPQTAPARSEDRVDLSGTPILGALFEERIAPGDAARGVHLGRLTRQGDTLVLDLGPLEASALARVMAAPLVLTGELPRVGAVSFQLPPPDWAQGRAAPGGEAVGAGYYLDGRLVLAATGGGPAIPDLGRVLEGLF